MGKIILFWMLMSTSIFFGQSATRIKFTYDAAGNQIQRTICLCTAKTDNDSIYKNEETVTDNDMIEDAEYETISYYPNPVREELYVSWKNTNEAYVSNIEVYSMTGQLMKTYFNLKEAEKASIAFHDFPEGLYNLILVYNNDERKTLKIVKK